MSNHNDRSSGLVKACDISISRVARSKLALQVREGSQELIN